MSETHSNGLEVAIIGLACRYPGAESKTDFWANLLENRETVAFPTEEELILAGCDIDEILRSDYIKASGALQHPFAFDADFFGVSKSEAEVMDPQHRMFLTCCWEAFEDAGYIPDEIDVTVGVIAGCMANTYYSNHIAPNKERVTWLGAPLLALSNQSTYMPNRVSYKLNLNGPSFSVNTACSTSLVAIHLACKSLLAGECDMVVAGAAAISFPHGIGFRTYGETGGAVSNDGHCRPFDAAAAGMIPGSGTGVAVLKRLDDALRDGDHIYSVIKGSAINNDGQTKVGFLAPSVFGQREVIRDALNMAEVKAETICFVEAHGTATPLGDPIEVQALTEAFTSSDGSSYNKCALGSVKGNIGHTQEAAGMAGLIKSALALEQRHLPQQINFSAPNEELHLDETPFFIADKELDWKSDSTVLRAGVSSFGLGGANAHVVLEQAPLYTPENSSRVDQLLTISARTQEQLKTAATLLANALTSISPSLFANVAFTLHTGRKAFAFRKSFVVPFEGSAEKIRTIIDQLGDGEEGLLIPASKNSELVLVILGDNLFTSSDIQVWLNGSTHFEIAWKECMACATESAQKVIGDWLSSTPVTEKCIHQDIFRSLAVFAARFALAKTWIAMGVTPKAVGGFGEGQYVAAVLAESLSLKDAVGMLLKEPTSPTFTKPSLPLYLENIEKCVEDQITLQNALSNAVITSIPSATSVSKLIELFAVPLYVDINRSESSVFTTIGEETLAKIDPNNIDSSLQRLIGVLWERGCQIDWSLFHKDENCHRTPLPTYPFDKTQHYLEIPLTPIVQQGAGADVKPETPTIEEVVDDDVQNILRDKIAEAWREILGVEDVHPDSNFASIGGDSLQFFRLAGTIRDMFEIELEIKSLFEAVTLAEQALLVERLLRDKIDAVAAD